MRAREEKRSVLGWNKSLVESNLEEAQTYVCLPTSSIIILVLSGKYLFSEIFNKWVPGIGWFSPFSSTRVYTLSIPGLSTSGAKCGCHEISSKLIIFYGVEILFSCVHNILRILPFEWVRLAFVDINGSDKGSCCGFCLGAGGRDVKADRYSLNVGSNQSHDRENSSRRKLPKDYIIPSSKNEGCGIKRMKVIFYWRLCEPIWHEDSKVQQKI